MAPSATVCWICSVSVSSAKLAVMQNGGPVKHALMAKQVCDGQILATCIKHHMHVTAQMQRQYCSNCKGGRQCAVGADMAGRGDIAQPGRTSPGTAAEALLQRQL